MKWNDIPGFPNWQASDTGMIRTLYFHPPRILKPRLKRGYLEVTKHYGYRPSGSKIKKRFPVHRLVLLTFIGPCPEGMECLHRNNIKTDNRLDNLKWGTRSRNAQDLYKEQGYTGFRLNRDQAIDVKYLRFLGISRREVAKIHGVSEAAVYLICSGKVWKELC